MTRHIDTFVAAALYACLAAITVDAHGQAAGAFPEFGDARLKSGRTVWMGTCRECHANPLSDAPQVKDKGQWEKRRAKGPVALYESALKGRVSAKTEMPPRGGNPKLTDEDVRAAVDYMLAIVK
jgi:cytochrome c5